MPTPLLAAKADRVAEWNRILRAREPGVAERRPMDASAVPGRPGRHAKIIGPPATTLRGCSMLQLARRIGRAKPSAIMLVAEKAKRLKAEGRDIISFSIGVPNFLPGDARLCRRRAKRWRKDCGQYGSNRGSDALLDAFLEPHRAGRPDRLHARQLRHRHRRQARASTTWPRRCSTKATRSRSRCRTGPATSTSPRS